MFILTVPQALARPQSPRRNLLIHTEPTCPHALTSRNDFFSNLLAAPNLRLYIPNPTKPLSENMALTS
jgi:hypothetical protein